MQIDSDKIFLEILEELRNLNKTNQENKESLNQMADYLREYQSVMDFQLKDVTGENQRMMRELKSQVTRMSALVDPDIAGLYRGAQVTVPSNEINPLYNINKTNLIYYAEQIATSPIYNRAYYVVGYLSNLGTAYALIDDGVTTPMTSTQLLKVVSTSASDSGAGTGIQQLQLRGVNSSGLKFYENITLNGTTVVTTVNQFAQIDTASTLATGSSGGAVGTITISGATDSTSYGTIVITENQWRSGCFFTDSSAAGYIDNWSFASYTNAVRAQLRASSSQGSGYTTLVARDTCIVQNASYGIYFPVPIRIPKVGWAIVRAISKNAATEVTTAFQLHFRQE